MTALEDDDTTGNGNGDGYVETELSLYNISEIKKASGSKTKAKKSMEPSR